MLVAFGCLTAMAWAQVGTTNSAPPHSPEPAASSGTGQQEQITLFDPIIGKKFEWYEKVALIANVVVALAGLAYALMLVGQVRRRRRERRGCRKSPRPSARGPTPICIGSSAWWAC